MKRTLRLNRESLAELTPADLHDVVGAAQAATGQGFTCPALKCPSDVLSLPNCYNETWNTCS